MSLQRIIAWVVLAAGVTAAVVGLTVGGAAATVGWTGRGVAQVAGLVAVYGLAVAGVVRWRAGVFFPALGAVVAGYSMLALGPMAVVGAVWVVVGGYGTGAWMMQRRVRFIRKYPQVVTVLGMGAWAVWLSVAAQWPMHTVWLYTAAFGAAVFQLYRLRLIQAALPEWPQGRTETAWAAVAMFPAVLNWLGALKPEVSAAGMSMHLPLAARMAAERHWAFDGAEFSWAVGPLNGDWIWTLAYMVGGEGGAKLMNALVLALVCSLLYTWLHELLPGRMAALLTAGYGTAPVVMGVTGSLETGNVAGAFLLAGLVFHRRYMKAQKLSDAVAAAFLAGAAAGTSLGAGGLVVALMLVTLMTFQGRHVVYAGAAGLATSLIPYITAAWRTGNPIFPHMNHYFRSPLFDMVQPLRDSRMSEGLNWRTWYDLAFHGTKFGAPGDGAMGVMLFVLVPLSVVTVRGGWPKVGLAALWTSVVGAVILLWASPEAGLLYPALPLMTLAVGAAAAMLRADSRRMDFAVAGWCGLSIMVHLAMLPAAGAEHATPFLGRVFDGGGVERYLARFAPEKPLVEKMKRLKPDARAAWMETNAIGAFAGRAWTNTPDSYGFWRAMQNSTAAEGHLFLAEENRIEYFIAPVAESQRAMSNVFTREFLDLYTDPVERFGEFELRKMAPVRRSLAEIPQPYAGAGVHDELNSFVRYEGPWSRGMGFDKAHKGTLAFTNDARARVHIRFEGRAITLIHTAALNRCRLMAVLDGAESVAFSQNSEQTQWQARTRRFEAPPGYHTLTVQFPALAHGVPSALGCFADLDGFVVE
ncbi:MAG: hypothetical protein C0504_15545 [Candidatus Solibacter sp.]|nr:hypothetical protein [Candidatus Solibacter sp.]